MGNEQSTPQGTKEPQNDLNKPLPKQNHYLGLGEPITKPFQPFNFFPDNTHDKSKSIPESTEKKSINFMDEIQKIKNECPPCPKYDFDNSEEARQIREQIISKFNKLGYIIKDDMKKQLINNIINLEIKSPVDTITLEILVERINILDILDKQLIDNIINKCNKKQIKIFYDIPNLNKVFKSQLKQKLDIMTQIKYLKYKKKYLKLK